MDKNIPKGSSTLRIKAELETTLNTKYPIYTPIYMEGSKMEGKVGCAVVTPTEIREIRLQSPFSIFNAEAEAINTAINMTKTSEQSKRVILSDSLSCLTALNEMKKIDNSKVMKMMYQIHRENEHLTLMWVPGHAEMKGNEKADLHAEWASSENSMCDIETRNKKKQQHTNTHEKRTGESFETENVLHTTHSRTPGGSRATA
jgi:ribonuclease HI